MKNKEKLDKVLLAVAKRHFHSVETLETRNRDCLDFHDVSVWGIKASLKDVWDMQEAKIKRLQKKLKQANISIKSLCES
jgi:hypothetical protein